MRSNHEFDDYYEQNQNWMDEPGINVKETLKGFYPKYFVADEPNYNLIKQDIMANIKGAKELFKALFRVPFKLKQNQYNQLLNYLNEIEVNYGDKIYAHGVEEAKGGHYNLLLILISDCIRVNPQYWGFFQKGLPNISPLSHGPYYLIAQPNETYVAQNEPFSKIKYVVVPFEENKLWLMNTAAQLFQVGMITAEQRNSFSSKLQTYAEFLKILQNNTFVADVIVSQESAGSASPLEESNTARQTKIGIKRRFFNLDSELTTGPTLFTNVTTCVTSTATSANNQQSLSENNAASNIRPQANVRKRRLYDANPETNIPPQITSTTTTNTSSSMSSTSTTTTPSAANSVSSSSINTDVSQPPANNSEESEDSAQKLEYRKFDR